MTSGLTHPSNYYLTLVTSFPPRPITNEAELIATQQRINSILDKKDINQDDRDYLRVLGMLVYDYEEKYESLPKLADRELLKAIMEEYNLQVNDLGDIFTDEATVLAILEGKRKLTPDELKALTNLYL